MLQKISLAARVRDIFCVDLRSLAIFRMAIAMIILADLIARSLSLEAHYADFGVLPRAIFIEKFSPPFRFSLHFLSGDPYFQLGLFILAGIFACMLLVGLYTRMATLLSWFFMISLHARNPLVLQGGDLLLRMVLFWSIFLPLGAKWSFDSHKAGARRIISNSYLSLANVAYFVQIAFVYWSTAAEKLSPRSFSIWWEQGSAIYYALNIDQFATPLAIFIRQFPLLMKIMNYAVIVFEIVGPLLFFSPIATGTMRTLAVVTFISLHIGFGSCLVLGPFPWVGAAAMLPFIPTCVWGKISFVKKTQTATQPLSLSVPSSPLTDNLVGICLIYITFWNIGNLYPSLGVPRLFHEMGNLISLDQRWHMFSPPLREDGWYVVPGTLKNGEKVDLIKDGAPVDWEKPALLSRQLKTERWRKYMMNLWIKKHAGHRALYAAYLCRNWNRKHIGNQELEEVEIVYMRETTYPDFIEKPQKISLLKYACQ